MSTILLFVPYEEKHYAKMLDAKYDADLKSWYCSEDKKECIERWARRFVKNIQYDRKEEYKLLNCKENLSQLKKTYPEFFTLML